MKNLLCLILFLSSTTLWAQKTHEAEASVVSAGGNTQVETYLFRTLHQWVEKVNTYRFSGHYTYGESNEQVSARDWDLNFRYEKLVRRNMALYVGEVLEGFKFQGIKVRYSTDVGVKYYFIKSDLKNFLSEAGYRYSSEDRYQPAENQYEHKLRFYTEYNQKVSERFSHRHWVEYVPNLTNSKDYLLNFETSLTASLSEKFSLKVAYRGMYDQDPAIAGNKNYDYTYTTSLIAKWD